MLLNRISKILLLVSFSLFQTLIILSVIFLVPWTSKQEEYVDVDWEWNDDFDRYDIRIYERDDKWYSIRTKKATVVCVGEEFQTFCVVTTTKSLTGRVMSEKVTSFYINSYYIVKTEMEEDL